MVYITKRVACGGLFGPVREDVYNQRIMVDVYHTHSKMAVYTWHVLCFCRTHANRRFTVLHHLFCSLLPYMHGTKQTSDQQQKPLSGITFFDLERISISLPDLTRTRPCYRGRKARLGRHGQLRQLIEKKCPAEHSYARFFQQLVKLILLSKAFTHYTSGVNIT